MRLHRELFRRVIGPLGYTLAVLDFILFQLGLRSTEESFLLRACL